MQDNEKKKHTATQSAKEAKAAKDKLAKLAKAAERERAKTTKAVEADRDAVQIECDSLAQVTERLTQGLMDSQTMARDLQEELEKIKMPQYINLDCEEKSGRSSRRTVHSDWLYLKNILGSPLS